MEHITITAALEILELSVNDMLDLVGQGELSAELWLDVKKMYLRKLKRIEGRLRNGQSEQSKRNCKVKKATCKG